MKERQYLEKTIQLCGESDGTAFMRSFHIVKKIDEGASSVCYEAYHENSGRGTLKEFYPQDAYGLERYENGQLIHSSEFQDAYARFVKAERDFIEPYEMLLKAKQSGSDQDLATFIPAFEIYHGCDSAGNVIGTTYIWTPEPKVETFDKICDDIHKHPTETPERKLVTVLTAIESLAKCIRALHSADMVHRDIKPSNFGFLKRGNETLTQTLSMFDINSVCSVYGDIDRAVGTEGFMEPEARYEAADNQTDIYSIGATLFNAVIVTDETEAGDYLFNSGYYDRLREMVAESKLIQASEANSYLRLRNALVTILQKCLCERTYRYANCEELLVDLETALYYALPSDIAKTQREGKAWRLIDVEKSLDVNAEKNSFLSIQYHLYQHPLYQHSPGDDEALNVLVVGFGNYGQKFMDACLQDGQIVNKRLNVTVISDGNEDKDDYLDDRPQLAKFFNVDGSLVDDKESYGNVFFENKSLERTNKEKNKEILQDVLFEHYDGKCPHYIFIALGEDGLNRSAAEACKEVIDAFGTKCVISYACEKKPANVIQEEMLYPIYVNEKVSQLSIYKDIERMAFNTHLIWEKNFNVDYSSVRSKFRKPYYHDSCVSNVLALKYKLYSMGIDLGIDLGDTGFKDAAQKFSVAMADKGNRDLKNALIWIEHRRWVTEKICLGWSGIKNLDECAGGITKDKKAKKHVCMVRSRPDQKLAVEYRSGTNYAKWDEAPTKDLDQLDELDRMSVELHRMYARKAKVAKKQNLLSGNHIAGIRTMIEGNKKATVAFQEWYTCLKDIWNGDIRRVHLYKGLKDTFLGASDSLPSERKKSVKEQVNAFEAVFYPVLASMEYRDWKQDDVAFIDNIPFVLTYTENAYLIIPFTTGKNSDVFKNVSAATVVSPARILYLYSVERKQDVQDLRDSVPYVMEYMKKKHFKAAVEFVIAVPEALKSIMNDEVANEIKRAGVGRIRQVKLITIDGIKTVPQEFELYLKQRAADERFFAVEKNSTKLSALLQGAGIHNSFANYKFDSATMKFDSLTGCDMLRYIKKSPYITVSDMVAFRLSSSESSNNPEFFEEYRDLWKRYNENIGTWKLLCNLLGKYAEKNDTLVAFEKKVSRDKSQDASELHFIVPFVCNKSVAKIIRFLKEQEILEEGSRVNAYTTDSCKVIIVDRCGNRPLYEKLFANVYALMLSDAISLHLNTKSHEVNVVFDDLVVDGVQIPSSKKTELSDLLNYFREKGFIINLTIGQDGRTSFTYATRQIKTLLSTAGKMLEVYTYHKIKELGGFDDVVSSFEIDWEGTDVTSEIDCILTKGFRTLFVECKARTDIEQEFYFRLASLADQFGINATAVLIADTREKSFFDNAPANAMQRRRGSMMDVVTIWKPNEISNIGHTLLKVINGRYKNEEE